MLKQKAAFFDVDNTLLDIKSMFSFQQYYFEHMEAYNAGAESYSDFVQALQTHPQRHDRLVLNRLFYQSFAGRRQTVLAALAEAWFASLRRVHGEALWIRPALELAETLRTEGYQLAAVSGSCHEILAPLIRYLGFDACLATTLEVSGGLYTGNIAGIQMIGEGKGVAMRQYAEVRGINLADCVACGDHITDLPMLEMAGEAYVVAGDPPLEQLAHSRGWPVLTVDSALEQAEAVHV
jgi:HAD superfamily hydrolase (TIGR01490 family)